jgi:hypothetical protein
MEEKVNVWKANLMNGLILGLAGIVYSLIMYFLDLTLNKTQGYVFIVVEAGLLFLFLKAYRDNVKHGQITYGESFGAGVIISLYYSIIMAVFIYILYSFIDPGLVKKSLAMAEEIMQKKGIPEASMDMAMKMQEKIMKPQIIAPLSIFMNMIWGVVLSLIISIFIKKDGNPLIETPVN